MSALITPDNLRLAMGLTFFPIGLLAILSGMVMLIAGPYRKESQALAVAQSATALIEAVNKLIQTSSGNAVVLIGIGALLEAASYWLLVVSPLR